jgi:RimJ/RimL family protein N-acetyltransferase/phage FluMu protein Com
MKVCNSPYCDGVNPPFPACSFICPFAFLSSTVIARVSIQPGTSECQKAVANRRSGVRNCFEIAPVCSHPRIMDSELVGEDYLDFKCPHCGALNSFPTSAAKLVRECVNCLDLFVVPEKDGEPARKLSLEVEGPRIRLRFFEARDWKDLLEYQFQDEDEATGWILKSSTLRTSEHRDPFYLAAEVRETHKVVGTVGFRFLDVSFNQVEISLEANTAAQLPGLELEALEAALAFCFQEMSLHRVVFQCEASEAERRKLLNELGMRQEAEFVKQWYIDGKWVSTVWFAMLEEEYFREQKAEKI